MGMVMKRAMASNNNGDNNNDHDNNNNRDNNNDQDDSGNEDNNTKDNDNNEDDDNNDEYKHSVAAAVSCFIGSGGISGGNRGVIGGGGFGRWRVVTVVGLAVADGSGGACSGCKPRRLCLKKLMGSQAMTNDVMDIQGKAGVGGGGG
jgi:hypothetical protein